MSFRKRKNEDSDEDESEDEKTLDQDDDDMEQGPSAPKKSRNIWSDFILEEQLLKKGQSIQLDKLPKNQTTLARGPESYVMPEEELERKNRTMGKNKNGKNVVVEDNPVFVVTPANDDPFGEEPISLNENFGVKKEEIASVSDVGWWANKGHAKKMQHQSKKPYIAKKTSQLMSSAYSLESLLGWEFEDGIDAEQLGTEMAKAMGEKDPDTVKKIVKSLGNQLAMKLFNETREIEKEGGMKTANGDRRRTPGGVFITLFKLDSEVSREVKDAIFGDMKQMEREKVKSRKKAHNFERKLEDIKKTMDLAKEEEEKLAQEELGILNDPIEPTVFDDVADML